MAICGVPQYGEDSPGLRQRYAAHALRRRRVYGHTHCPIVWSRLETWEGSIDVTLDRNGDFEVRMGEKNYPRTLIAAGNVNTRQLVESANVN